MWISVGTLALWRGFIAQATSSAVLCLADTVLLLSAVVFVCTSVTKLILAAAAYLWKSIQALR